jgi:hypothetical protein
MLDTNVFDRIIATKGLVDVLNRKARLGDLQILTTPIQEQELFDMADLRRRRAAQRLERQVVPTASPPDVTPTLAPSAKHLRDALIGHTASAMADLLVTEDGAFLRRMQAEGVGCRVISFGEFQRLLDEEPR